MFIAPKEGSSMTKHLAGMKSGKVFGFGDQRSGSAAGLKIIRLGCKVFRFAYNPGNGTLRVGMGSDDLGIDIKSVPLFCRMAAAAVGNGGGR
jgi:hypothetical protein